MFKGWPRDRHVQRLVTKPSELFLHRLEGRAHMKTEGQRSEKAPSFRLARPLGKTGHKGNTTTNRRPPKERRYVRTDNETGWLAGWPGPDYWRRWSSRPRWGLPAAAPLEAQYEPGAPTAPKKLHAVVLTDGVNCGGSGNNIACQVTLRWESPTSGGDNLTGHRLRACRSSGGSCDPWEEDDLTTRGIILVDKGT